jgi:hypothetical protein
MQRCVLVGLLAIFGAACGLPLNGLGEAPAGDTAPGAHPTGPGGTSGTQAEGGSGLTSNDAGALTPEASAPESGAQLDAADDGGDASDADDSGNDSGDQDGGHGGGKGGDLRFGAY